MTFDEYQDKAFSFSLIQEGEKLSVYTALGLNGEAGEIAEKVKKVLRDHDGDFSKLDTQDIAKELGDVLWYVSAFAKSVGLSLDDIATGNIDKLSSRKDRGVLQGSGDNR